MFSLSVPSLYQCFVVGLSVVFHLVNSDLDLTHNSISLLANFNLKKYDFIEI